MSAWRNLSVRIDGAEADPGLLDLAVGLRLDRVANAPSRLSVRLALRAGEPLPDARRGCELALFQGSRHLFSGTVTGTRQESRAEGRTLDLVAHDALWQLSRRRTLSGGGIASVAAHLAQMADALGLGFETFGDDQPFGRHAMTACDDLTHLVRILERYGVIVRVRSGTLQMLDGVAASSGLPVLLDPYEAVEEDETLPDAPGWLGWTPASDGKILPHGARVDRVGPVGVPLGEGDNAARIFAADQARRMARACWIEAAMTGLPDLWPGDAVALVPGGHSYRLHRVGLALDAAGGARVTVSSRPPERQAETGAVVMTGLVTDIDDPQDAGRVRVRLPAFGDGVTGWLSVLGAVGSGGGGTGLGIPLSPGDPVAVLAPGGDADLGLVLGGLLRAGGAQRGLVSGGRRSGQVWRSAGSTIVMDETAGTLTLALDGGPSIELGEGGIRLTSAGALDLDCNGKVRIRGSRIDFEEA